MPIKSHGMSQTSIYNIWLLMRKRCADPKCPAYKNYGGRGISVCKRWMKFENFYADMGERPEGKSLDRINNNRGYSKNNCRWATPKEQSANSRRPRMVSFRGRTYSISEFCRIARVSYNTIRARIQRGWSLDCAISKSIGKYGN